LSVKPEKIHVKIEYKGVAQEFSAEPQEAWLLIDQFFRGIVPTFEIAQKLLLNVDVQQLAKDIDGIVAFSSDGASLLVPKNKLTDNEALLLWLLANYLGQKLGLLGSDSLSKDELQAKLGKSGKITSTRLGELVKNDFVARGTDEKFRITTFGVVQSQKEALPRIKSKINA
jgi:hypothetical protein